MGKDNYFKQGIPKFDPDLSYINPRYNNIVETVLSFPNFSPKGCKKYSVTLLSHRYQYAVYLIPYRFVQRTLPERC